MTDRPKEGEKTLFLIDGSSYIYRAYHAIRSLSTRSGFPTNAIFGFANMVLKVLRDHKPTYAAMVLDAPGPTFRHEMYPEYKANRPPMPEDLVVQMPRIDDVIAAFKLPAIRIQGVEADDIIATLARKYAGEVDRVVIISSDKDLMQLVGGNVVMLDTMKDQWMDEKAVFEKFGVEPSRVVHVQALMGDSSDNIPGLPGVGPKTAGKLIAQFGSVEELLERHLEVGGKLGDKLPEQAEALLSSLSLVTLKDDIAVDKVLDDLVLSGLDTQAVRALFEDLEFVKLANELVPRESLGREGYRTVTTKEELDHLAARLQGVDRFAFDTETDSLDPMRASLVGISFSWAEGEAAYIPLDHRYLGAPVQLTPQVVKKKLGPLMADPDKKKIGQNIKYDLKVLHRAGWEVRGISFDTMIASWLNSPDRRSHGLDEIASELFGHTMITYKELTKRGREQVSMIEVPVDEASTYSCEDADVTFRAVGPLDSGLEEKELVDLFHEVEMPLVVVLGDMEMAGVLLDTGMLSRISLDLGERLRALEGRIHEEAGHPFNINSPRQLAQVLFTELGLAPLKKTKTGYSTNDEVLLELSEKHHMPAMIRDFRSVAKLKSTYVDALPKLIHPETGRVHTSFNQTATSTGRLSSSDPNLQNIPIRTDEGRRIREAFVAPDGTVLLSADYSQIELRILAHLSGDQNLMEAFRNGEDIHNQTACQVLGARDQAVEPELRRRAKVINFGIIYGMSAYGLSKELGVSPGEAAGIIDGYFEVYSGVRDFTARTVDQARETGYVQTLLNRRRYLPELASKNPNTRQYGERMAVNTPIQGTAADLIKVAMLRIHEGLALGVPGARMLLQVHDELVFEVPEGQTQEASAFVSGIMEGVMELEVPLIVDVGWGKNWAEAH
ncbi:MAG: DNA polymerase I [bacterium]|nr:DNA polymerase I [bacterium]MDT8366279.1 DNA polymerase I [bacterium]